MDIMLSIRLGTRQRDALRRGVATERRCEAALIHDMLNLGIQAGIRFLRNSHWWWHCQLAEAFADEPIAKTYSPPELALMNICRLDTGPLVGIHNPWLLLTGNDDVR